MATVTTQLYCACCNGAPFCVWADPFVGIDLVLTIPTFTGNVCTAGTYQMYWDAGYSWGTPSPYTVDNPGQSDAGSCDYPQTVLVSLGCDLVDGFALFVSGIGGTIPVTLVAYTMTPFSITFKADSLYFTNTTGTDVFLIISEP